MENKLNIFTMKDLKGYTLEIWLSAINKYLYCIEIKDIIGTPVFKCNIHYDYLMHILFNDIPALYEYGEPFMENIPINSTMNTISVYGCDNENEDILIIFEETSIFQNKSSKIVELTFNGEYIYNTLQSGELIEKMDI